MNNLQYAPVYFHPVHVIGTMFCMDKPTINSVLTALMERKNINAHQLAAALIELDPGEEEQKKDFQPTIWRILNSPDYTPTLPTLRVLAAYFDLTISQLIGEVPLPGDDDTDTVVKAMQSMPLYKRTALVSMARSLVADEAATPPPAAPADAAPDQAHAGGDARTESPATTPKVNARERRREIDRRTTKFSSGEVKDVKQ